MNNKLLYPLYDKPSASSTVLFEVVMVRLSSPLLSQSELEKLPLCTDWQQGHICLQHTAYSVLSPLPSKTCTVSSLCVHQELLLSWCQ
jgi:hypothetical protein